MPTLASTVPALPTPLLAVRLAAEPGAGWPVVTIDADGGFGPGAGEAGVDSELARRLGNGGAPGELHRLALSPDAAGWLVGIGAGEPRHWRCAGASVAAAVLAAEHAVEHGGGSWPAPVTWPLPGPGPAELGGAELDEARLTALVQGLVLGSHSYRVGRSASVHERLPVTLVTAEPDRLVQTVELAAELAAATGLARDLADTPSDVKSPAWLAEQAVRLTRSLPGLSSRVWTEGELAQGGFGGILAVGSGSARPPRFLRLDWSPAGLRRGQPHLVLIGKGVTFDTGGISIKPANGMHWMRTDMSGGAAVIATLRAIGRLKLPARVTGLVPMAENHVSGSAYRPGDVVRHYDGRTTEVTNTDAEGRMLLADALGYAVAELAPDAIVDVATLTGSMKIALGLRTGGLFATDDALAVALLAAGERAGERWWRMPLLEHVAEEVSSELADVRQIPPGPGSIAAAQFLREFTGELPWAHLDIAGPARAEKRYDEVSEGATGFATRTLIELVRAYSSSSTDTVPQVHSR